MRGGGVIITVVSGTNIRAVGGIQHPAAEWMLLDGVDKLKWWRRGRRM